MKPLLKVMLLLSAIFATTFVLGRVFGILTAENVKIWLEWAQSIDAVWVAGTVILLLFIDLFIAVPTLTITLLAGYFLGFGLGSLAALTGVTLAAITGYLISWKWGDWAISKLVRDPQSRKDLVGAFHASGPAMIMLSRAAPIVPEVTACMAGATRMPFLKFALFFLIGSVPYVLIASYAGSISTSENPKPAIYAALALYSVLWIGWYFFKRKTRQSDISHAN